MEQVLQEETEKNRATPRSVFLQKETKGTKHEPQWSGFVLFVSFCKACFRLTALFPSVPSCENTPFLSASFSSFPSVKTNQSQRRCHHG